MNILFSPEYAGTVYAKAADGSKVMMDTVVTNQNCHCSDGDVLC